MSPETRVLKFGGSSVADPAVMRRAAMVATAALSRDGRPGSGPGVVVVSALGGVTRELVRVADSALSGDLAGAQRGVDGLDERHRTFLVNLELSAETRAEVERWVADRLDELRALLGKADDRSGERSRAFQDAVLAFGELLASRFFWAELDNLGVRSDWIDARSFLRTDDRFGAAAPDLDATRVLVRDVVLPSLESGRSVVVPGFVGATEDGRSTTMGFEASDLTATVLGSVLGAREVQIWTDVSGVLSADPRVVEMAAPVPHLGYDTARELAFLGARVLHPDTIDPARQAGISVRVMNSRRPGDAGTTIDARDPAGPESTRVLVAARSNQFLVAVHVDSDMARPVLAFLREFAREAGVSDALFAVREGGGRRAEVLVVGSDPDTLGELSTHAGRFGETTLSDGWSTVSIVACSNGRPSWPGVSGAQKWDGLVRSVGVLVPDAERDDLVRSVHARTAEPAAARVDRVMS